MLECRQWSNKSLNLCTFYTVFYRDKKRCCASFETPQAFCEYFMKLGKKERTFNERIECSTNYPCRFYADLDIKNPQDNLTPEKVIWKFLEAFEKTLGSFAQEQFEIRKCFFSNGSRANKLSLHFVYHGRNHSRIIRS